MESSTKRKVTEAELVQLVHRGFGAQTEIARWHELTDGTYNAAYAVTLADERDLVLKVAPAPGLKLLTHEVDLMRTEVDFYRLTSGAGVPVPEVAFADFDRDLLDSDYAFLSRIPGTDLHSSLKELTPAETADVRGQVAGLTARIHRITGPGYGYPLRDSRSWQSTWRGAFGAMVDDLVADAQRLDKPLPVPPERIGAMIRRHADVLDEVDRPALVHFDLWDGNVFIVPTSGGWRVAGFIDGERAFYGDPVAEFVSLALFRDLADAPEILAGYDPPIELNASVSRRLNLYTTYLFTIMAVEGATRGWDGDERARYEEWLLERLDAQLAML
ncbi:phosphotransferase family protein [Phytohabitans rumicis]|uniref:Phosphotransferase n=1 Tax=Phytohabitans rumicis TaxID=1076125 RepID=A0A6V8LG42_9ACTN|nr:aminoglycoside phosphotransferase family protein [Phytohabitans rumicis]GFJ93056.1 phosphotransferase [Phytohabitans rumicis]